MHFFFVASFSFISVGLNGTNRYQPLDSIEPRQLRALTHRNTASVDLSGKLILLGEEYETEDYCLAENWENVGGESSEGVGTVGALSCDQCMEEVGW